MRRGCQVNSIDSAKLVKITPVAHRGQAEIAPLHRTPSAVGSASPTNVWFSYQRDRFTYDPSTNSFARLAYPCDDPALTIGDYQDKLSSGLQSSKQLEAYKVDYGKNHFDIPVPTFRELFAEHAVAPFFVFQLFCVSLWCLDEYWYYSLFTLFMLVVFECTVVFQVGCNEASIRREQRKTYALAPFSSANAHSTNSEQCPSSPTLSTSIGKEIGRRSRVTTFFLVTSSRLSAQRKSLACHAIFCCCRDHASSTKPCCQENRRLY